MRLDLPSQFYQLFRFFEIALPPWPYPATQDGRWVIINSHLSLQFVLKWRIFVHYFSGLFCPGRYYIDNSYFTICQVCRSDFKQIQQKCRAQVMKNFVDFLCKNVFISIFNAMIMRFHIKTYITRAILRIQDQGEFLVDFLNKTMCYYKLYLTKYRNIDLSNMCTM